jgi:hypothetical protein
MTSPTRFFWSSLTALLVSIAIAWAPTAFSVPGATGAGNSISLSVGEGPPGTSVHVDFPNCAGEFSHVTGVMWDGNPVSGSADFTVPHDAPTGEHTVRAQCGNGAVGDGSAPFTVTQSDGEDNGGTTTKPVYDAELTLDPTQGATGTTVTATGSGFNCPAVDVVWDVAGGPTTLASTDVSSEGTFATRFAVPAEASETTYTVQAECTHEPYTSDDADFRVTSTATDGTETDGGTTDGTDGTTGETNGGTTDETTGGTDGGTTDETTGGTDGGTTGGTDGGSVGGANGGDTGGTDGGGNTTPIGLVVGPPAFAALLLLAGLFALLTHRHRGPRWVRDHVRTALRPGAGTADLHEHRDARSSNRTVRFEPHTDPGDQSLH